MWCSVGHGVKSHRTAPVRPCVGRLGAGRCIPTTGTKPLCGPCGRKSGTESRLLENSIFPISVLKFNSLKNILSPLVPAVSLESGAFDFSTRIKGGGRKAPASQSQRPAVRGVSRDCGISPQRRARWSLKGLFGFRVVGPLRKSSVSKEFHAFLPTLWAAMPRISQKLCRINKERRPAPGMENQMLLTKRAPSGKV